MVRQIACFRTAQIAQRLQVECERLEVQKRKVERGLCVCVSNLNLSVPFSKGYLEAELLGYG